MFGIAYQVPPVAPPDKYPCLACKVHGPYCSDFCALLDAWREVQLKQGNPKPDGGKRDGH